MTEVAVPESPGSELATAPPLTGLLLWAEEAKAAHAIARSIARTPFVPRSLRADPAKMPGKTPEEREAMAYDVTVGNVTAAILTGNELGLLPMASMRSIDLIDGTPGMRAHMMRGLVMSHGHQLEVVSSTDERCVYRGRRRLGSDPEGQPLWGEWQQVEWDLDRARRLKLVGREQWMKQPRTMLLNRATGEISRVIASDVLHGVQYAVEELEDSRDARPAGSPGASPLPQLAAPVAAAEVIDKRRAAKGTEVPEPAPEEAPEQHDELSD